jgi:chromosome segregation ATPase
MARVKGREVVLELMDAVAQLEKTSSAHTEQLEAIAALAVETSAHVGRMSLQLGELAVRVGDVSKRMDDVSKRMDDVSMRTDTLAREMELLDRELATQADQFLAAVKLSRTNQEQVGRVARVLAAFADGNKTRFESIEDRLDALERKAG